MAGGAGPPGAGDHGSALLPAMERARQPLPARAPPGSGCAALPALGAKPAQWTQASSAPGQLCLEQPAGAAGPMELAAGGGDHGGSGFFLRAGGPTAGEAMRQAHPQLATHSGLRAGCGL